MQKQRVAFICVPNSCKSQMAETLGKIICADVYQYSKFLSELPKTDTTITKGCNVRCPFLPCGHRKDWGLEEPGRTVDEAILYTMQRIEEKVLDLKQHIASGE